MRYFGNVIIFLFVGIIVYSLISCCQDCDTKPFGDEIYLNETSDMVAYATTKPPCCDTCYVEKLCCSDCWSVMKLDSLTKDYPVGVTFIDTTRFTYDGDCYICERSFTRTSDSTVNYEPVCWIEN